MVKVILQQDIPGQGKKNQVIDASDGFARNYLIPKGKAIIATDEAILKIKNEEKRDKNNQKNLENNLRKIKSDIEMIQIEIKRKLINKKKLFGSLSPKEISDALNKKGVSVTSKQVNLKFPIKEAGEHVVEIILNKSIKTFVKITITEDI